MSTLIFMADTSIAHPAALTAEQPQSNPQPQLCVLCQFQVIEVSAGHGYSGNGYTVCPHCYNTPPPQHASQRDAMTMPCFQCAAPCLAQTERERINGFGVTGVAVCVYIGTRDGWRIHGGVAA